MEILTHPNPVLKQTAAEVDCSTDDELDVLVSTMVKAMYDASGVGLAAPQIGVQKRVIVFDLDDGVVALCNPRITALDDELSVDDEGCLSVPGIAVPIERAEHIRCDAQDLNGKKVSIEAKGLYARVLQHESDHLDGVLILDRAIPEERRDAIRRYNEVLDRLG